MTATFKIIFHNRFLTHKYRGRFLCLFFKKNKGCETASQGLISLISTFSSTGAKEHIVFTNSTNS
jgi:hypothetical protein